MTVSIHPLSCGTLSAARSMFELDGSDESITIPVPSWLIRHPQGTVLFDTGMPAALTSPGPLLDTVSLFFGVGLGKGDLVSERLKAAQVDPADVDVVVMSHLHFDHAGGLDLIPNARLVIQADEWAAGVDDELASSNSFQRELFDVGHDRLEIEGEHDLFGDGLVTCLPTPGHTPGHQSLRVRLDKREVVLCGDCAYFSTTLEGGALPPIGHDRVQQAASIDMLRALGERGAMLIPGHDPAVFASLPEMITSL